MRVCGGQMTASYSTSTMCMPPSPSPFNPLASCPAQMSKDAVQSREDLVYALRYLQGTLFIKRVRIVVVEPKTGAGPAVDSGRFVILGPIKRPGKAGKDYWEFAPLDNVRDGAARAYIDMRFPDYDKPMTTADIQALDEVGVGSG